MSFRIQGLPAPDFQHLFAMSSDELASRAAVRVTADAKPGFPCRISLTDAEPGEEVILVHYEHHRAPSPFRSSHAVYVRRGEVTFDAIDRVPDQLRSRTLSVRAFDVDGMMVGADLVDGREVESLIERLFRDPLAAYLHVHFAKQGCFAAKVQRA